jgi:hypothetical protein
MNRIAFRPVNPMRFLCNAIHLIFFDYTASVSRGRSQNPYNHLYNMLLFNL